MVSSFGHHTRAASESVTSQDAMHMYWEVDYNGYSPARVRHRIRVHVIVSSLTIMPVHSIHIQVMMCHSISVARISSISIHSHSLVKHIE